MEIKSATRRRPASIVLVLLLLAAAANPTRAADPQPMYQPEGAPANPRVAAQWNRYHDYAEATALFQKLAAEYPDRCRLQSLGRSYGKREMWVLTVTDFNTGKESEKAGFWIDGGIHANEIQATEVVLYTGWYLAESFGRNALVTRLLKERVFYLMPMMSPDSRDAHMYQPNSTHSPRSGLRPYDDDRDGLVDEDKPDDLDGDGHITQMRIRDPNGRWKSHPDYPHLMIQANANEKGEFTQLGAEGFDNDGDGRINEDGDGFYDPNRNWPWNWQPEAVQHGADRYPFSIGENRLVAEFIMAHPNIAGAQSYHNAGGMILRGPGVKTDRYEPADLQVFQEIGKQGEAMLPGYRYMDTANDLYEAFGLEIDWLYKMQGIIGYTNELFTAANYFRQKPEGGFFGKPEDQQMFNKLLLFGEGLVEWHEVDHPQYGKVEVGGMRKSWVRQPPSFLLEEECHRNMAFTLYHADQMPMVAVESVQTKILGSDLVEVTAVITNPKLMSSRTAADVKHRISPPDRLSITGDNIQVIAGMTSDNLLFRDPSEQKRRPQELRIDSVPGMKAVYARWIVQGSGPFTVTIRSTKGGTASRQSE